MNTPNVFIHGKVFGQRSQAHGIDLGMSCAGLEVRLNESRRSLLTFCDSVAMKKSRAQDNLLTSWMWGMHYDKR